MKIKLFSIFLIISLSILACSIFQPSGGDIQTAIAQTQTAITSQEPTMVSPSPTPILGQGRSIGNPGAPIIVEVFMDFQCPHCKEFSDQIVDQIIQTYVESGYVYYIFRHFPFLDDHVTGNESDQAANASMCAEEQNHFWEYHDILFANWDGENQNNFTDERLLGFAIELGLDMDRFTSCFTQNKFIDVINSDLEEGIHLGVKGTPAIIVNKEMITPGFVPSFEEISNAIESELSQTAETPEKIPSPPSLSSEPRLVFSTETESYSISNDVIYYQLTGGEVVAQNLITGENIWSSDYIGRVLGSDNDLIYIMPSPKRVDALDTGSGEFKWRYLARSDINYYYQEIITTDDTIMVWDQESINGLDRISGNQKYTLPNYRDFEIIDGLIVFDTARSVVSINTGQIILDLRETVDRFKICGDLIVYKENNTGTIEARNIENWEIVWNINIDGEIYCIENEENIYIITITDMYTLDGDLFAINRETGDILWRGLHVWVSCVANPDIFTWFGPRGNLEIYSNQGYGLTQAYDEKSHVLIWENSNDVISRVKGVIEDTLVANVWDGSPNSSDCVDNLGDTRILAGFEVISGIEKWKIEQFNISNIMYNRLFYVFRDNLKFINPSSGEVISEFQIGLSNFKYGFEEMDGYIIWRAEDHLSVIKP